MYSCEKSEEDNTNNDHIKHLIIFILMSYVIFMFMS